MCFLTTESIPLPLNTKLTASAAEVPVVIIGVTATEVLLVVRLIYVNERACIGAALVSCIQNPE